MPLKDIFNTGDQPWTGMSAEAALIEILDILRNGSISTSGGGSPLLAKGDLFTFSTSGARLPVGATGSVLTADPSQPTGLNWSTSSKAFAFFYREPVAGYGTIAIDAAVPFDTDGPSAGGIVRSSVTEFILPAVGTYDISWTVSVDEAGQLALFVNNGSGYIFQPQTVAGRAALTSQITNRVLITTTAANALIKVVNHSSAAALTLTTNPGGTSAGVTALTIVKIG